MAQRKTPQLLFGARLTAYEAPDHLDDLTAFIHEASENTPAYLDAAQVETIDTAGCQMIDLAITAARHKKATLELHLSDAVQEAFSGLGISAKEDSENDSENDGEVDGEVDRERRSP